MLALIDDLRAQGLRFAEEGPAPTSGPLAGKTFVLTGTLPTLSREQATERIQAAGGRVTSGVSKKTDYLVAGESPGSKLEKAERLEVAVLDERGFARSFGCVATIPSAPLRTISNRKVQCRGRHRHVTHVLSE